MIYVMCGAALIRLLRSSTNGGEEESNTGERGYLLPLGIIAFTTLATDIDAVALSHRLRKPTCPQLRDMHDCSALDAAAYH